MILQPLYLSLKVATASTLAVFVVGLILAIVLAKKHFPGKNVVETLVTLPLVLPPTVVGYYLLFVVGGHGLLGPLLAATQIQIIFTWVAAAIASAVVSLPLMVRTSKVAIESVDPSLEKAARTLGSPEWRVLLDVTLPLSRRGILAGVVLAFARGLGEFGATLMVAGNIPGRTQTMPLAIYSAVQTNRMGEANLLVLIMTAVSFIVLWMVNRWQREWWFRKAI
ncbi:molybdate transport system permease protein [Candidatus Hakubella thermalkaliphila]|uniref:Molybdenum transport system permease n=1 Tax=Candidatus Hakubella thermalkaliphila TaxID=2754717 RepID=A0A6V8PH91_9ACTN|nr:molybdate transport system permease protein [Candidatus Hakubella thermalkaliphila]